jgi:hypothetical protein
MARGSDECSVHAPERCESTRIMWILTESSEIRPIGRRTDHPNRTLGSRIRVLALERIPQPGDEDLAAHGFDEC